MARQRFSTIEQRAFWQAHNELCAYCDNPLRFRDVEIDHVIPEKLLDDPRTLVAVRASHGLGEDFDLTSDVNLVLSCRHCNSQKGGQLWTPERTAILLEKARRVAPKVAALREKFTRGRTKDKLLAQVQIEVDRGHLTTNDLGSLVGVAGLLPDSEIPRPPDHDSWTASSQSMDQASVLRLLGNASEALLGWPQETAGRWIDRPELVKLRRIVTTGGHSFSVLLGEPGSGKSALLARLGTQLRADGTALLAVKGDLLPKGIGSLTELDAWLGVPAPVVDCLCELAETQRVVLLVDQVDALSDLMDLHTDRLTTILALVNRLRNTDNVHILLSCREFEFRHDIRLLSLNPQPVRLADLGWEPVRELLEVRGVRVENWPEYARELLRRPQHLNLFVEHLAGGVECPAFQTYEAMLEAVIRKRVLEPYGTAGMSALETIAAAMAEEEELWLPVARFERQHGNEMDQLVAAGILSYTVDRLRVGFRHQKLFDFVRGRSFATGEGELADHVLEREDAVFVRPVLWSALHYLRGADRAAYRREFGRLWTHERLRRHLRLLLVSFLGQLPDPDLEEAHCLLPVLNDPSFSRKALLAMQGSQGWFAKLESRLPALMTTDDDSAWEASGVLRRALAFDGSAVLDLVERYWLPYPNRDNWTFRTVEDLKDWDERAVRAVEIVVGRTAIQVVFVDHMAEVICGSQPRLAPRVVVAHLWGELNRALAQPVAVLEPPREGTSENERAVRGFLLGRAECAPVQRIISDHWVELEKVAEAAPRAFLEHVWPWVVHVAQQYAHPVNERLERYRGDPLFELGDDCHLGRRHHLGCAVEVALLKLAKEDPDAYLSFAAVQGGSDLLIVHRLLSLGLEQLAAQMPNEVVSYLLADPRRLAIGPITDDHRETQRLIGAAAPHLDADAALRLEECIVGWHYCCNLSLGRAEERRQRRRWDRQHRLRLLRAFPRERLSAAGRKLLDEEERALPDTPRGGVARLEMECIGSPVSAEQMQKASDAQVLNLFEELHDGTGWQHPRYWLKGGSVEASREFAQFAKREPARALKLMERFEPSRHERPVAEALGALAEVQEVDARTVAEFIHLLHARGFGSEEFRSHSAWCLAKLAETLGGLDDKTCGLLEGWLCDAPISRAEPQRASGGDEPHSLLWGDGFAMLPHGNYPVLHALTLGYLLREPAASNDWLCVLERHLGRREASEVWETMAQRELWYLVWAARDRASDFLGQLHARHPEMFATAGGARLVARTHDWLPRAFTHRCLEEWVDGEWVDGPQAAGEVAMLRHALVPEDEFCKGFIDNVLRESGADPGRLAAQRLGVAYTASQLWGDPRWRAPASEVLLRLIPMAEGHLAEVVLDVFRSADPLPPDTHTDQLLDALVARPEVLRHGHSGFLIDRLKDLLRDGGDPQRICRLAHALLDECGQGVSDIRTAWAASAGDLVDIALTLQRLSQSRSCGLELFERLMDLDAYKIAEALREIDRPLPT